MNRTEILEKARGYVAEDREVTHGKPEDNFTMIAQYWSIHLGTEVTAVDVGVMMALLKTARIKFNPGYEDNYVDGAGYMACAGEIATRETETSTPKTVDGPETFTVKSLYPFHSGGVVRGASGGVAQSGPEVVAPPRKTFLAPSLGGFTRDD